LSDVRGCLFYLVSLLRFGFEMWRSGRVNLRGHCIIYFNKDWGIDVGRRPMAENFGYREESASSYVVSPFKSNLCSLNVVYCTGVNLYSLFILAAVSPPFQSVLALKIYNACAFVGHHHINFSCKYFSIWLKDGYVLIDLPRSLNNTFYVLRCLNSHW